MMRTVYACGMEGQTITTKGVVDGPLTSRPVSRDWLVVKRAASVSFPHRK